MLSEKQENKIWKSCQKLSFRVLLTMFCTLLNSVVYFFFVKQFCSILEEAYFKLADGTSENKHQKHYLKFMLVNCSCRQL